MTIAEPELDPWFYQTEILIPNLKLSSLVRSSKLHDQFDFGLDISVNRAIRRSGATSKRQSFDFATRY